MTDIKFTPAIKVLCPFCEGSYEAGYEGDGTPSVMHTMPPCEKFLELELVEFMREATKKMNGGVHPDEN